jgi:CubicO group peptidase (beta-lactamase class C family)
MGGVAGHAGVFSTVADTARYCRMLLNEGQLEGVRVLKSETVQEMIVNHIEPPVLAKRGYGWDIESDYSRPRGKWFSLFSYGHTGFTGTSLWIDPATRTFVIFFSNRVHPTRDGDVRVLQRSLSTLAAEALPEYDFGSTAK